MAERILVVEDDLDLRTFLAEVLEGSGYTVSPLPSAEAALREVEGGGEADLVITDLLMPGMRGQELLARLRTLRPELNVIAITAFGSIDSAIELIRAGAHDYLAKPFGADQLLVTVERALAESRLRREVARLARETGRPPAGFVAASRPMRELFQTLTRVAAARQPVLITGESGTGKELVARALHELSGRGPFVAVNCGAIPENLLESELFGHERGAFTGADRDKPGLFEAADAGTLFLDEIAELPLPLQPKLLRALEGGEVRRVGATRPRSVDVRLVSATHRDPEEEVRAGRMREDLFWRLNVLHLHVPPLRERPADVPLLAEHFLARAIEESPGAVARRISRDALALLTSYPWPGNVRELRNAIERAAALTTTEEIRREDLPPRIVDAAGRYALVSRASQRRLSLRDLEREYVLEVLREVGGNKSRAATLLGLDRKTLYRKLQEWSASEPGAGSGDRS